MTNSTQRQLGISLIELLISLAIGSLLMIGLITSFSNSNATKRNLEQSGRLIENGQYAINFLSDNIRHTGYYGPFNSLGAAPTGAAPANLPDPCNIGTTDTTSLTTGVTVPIQGYTAASLTARPVLTTTSCATNAVAPDAAKNLLTDANLQPGSDIIVIRRADTNELNAAPVTNEVYIQANSRASVIQIGNSSAAAGVVNWESANNADGLARDAASLRRYPNTNNATDFAETRKYHVDVYFVAPCSFGSATSGSVSGVCQAGDDTIPTLKRLELTSDGTNTIMDIFPLVEGVEYLKYEYGLDTIPAAVSGHTGYTGDGVPDSYVATPTTVAESVSVIAVRVYLLARSADTTPGFIDRKSYTLGTTAVAAANDNFKRHVFSAEVRLNNMAGRREIPE
jgi:type IV pilus assembly protein PilW